MSLRALPCYLISVFWLVVPVAAEGLLQVRFSGAVDGLSAPPTSGVSGQLVEFELGASVNGEARDLTLHIHLAPGTTGVELAGLVERRLQALGIRGVATARSGNLWIEDATYLNLRLGGGLSAWVACAEGAPTSLAVRPPTRRSAAQSFQVDVTTVIRPSGGLPIRGAASLTVPLDEASSAASISAALARAGQSKWISDRPKGDTWRPVKMSSGAAITGCSFTVQGAKADWRVDLVL